MAEEEGKEQEIEQQLESAICARLQHFNDQADSLTMESVRRLLEKDLGLEKFALDAHKRFIRLYLQKKMDGADGCTSETATKNADKDVPSKEAKIMPKQHETKTDKRKSSSGDEEIMEDSPIMGVLSPKAEVGTQGSSLSESSIKKAILKRSDHFHANSENITLAGVRRLLEEDLGLEKNTLDPFKKFISQQIDEVLTSPKKTKYVKDVKKKAVDILKAKKSKKVGREEGSDSSHSESDEVEVKVKSRKEFASKRNIKKSEQPKKRKISDESDLDISDKKRKKPMMRKNEKESDNNEDGSLSEDGQCQSYDEKLAQRKEKSVSGYGKKVENLKSIIKACGMSISPSIYKKAKQVPEEEREAFIVKELEGILSREGLSKNPTEKEIKDCKKRKDRARELEGIDMSNIVSSSRRRSTFSFAAPSKPGIPAKMIKVDAKDTKNKENKNNEKDYKDDEEEDKKKEKDDEEETKEKDDDEEETKEDDDDEETKEKDDEEEEVEGEEDDNDDEEEDEEEEEDESEDFNEDDNEDSD